MVPPPLHSYTQLYISTALYTVQLYSAIHYTTYTPPLCYFLDIGNDYYDYCALYDAPGLLPHVDGGVVTEDGRRNYDGE